MKTSEALLIRALAFEGVLRQWLAQCALDLDQIADCVAQVQARLLTQPRSLRCDEALFAQIFAYARAAVLEQGADAVPLSAAAAAPEASCGRGTPGPSDTAGVAGTASAGGTACAGGADRGSLPRVLPPVPRCPSRAQLQAHWAQALDRQRRALLTLPTECQRVFTLYKIYSLPREEVASRLSLSLADVERLLAVASQACARAEFGAALLPEGSPFAAATEDLGGAEGLPILRGAVN